jgi:hypothetical protein
MMPEEKVFLSAENVYVSNTKVVLNGTTYATANITSVSKRFTPASRGCATAIIAFGVLLLLGAFASFGGSHNNSPVIALLVAAVVLGAGVLWFRSLKPVYHVVLASSSGERQGLSSKDEPLVGRVVDAITNAITHRG